MNGNGTSLLEPAFEKIGIDPAYSWQLPLEVNKSPTKQINSVWYLALPISSAHRRGDWEKERNYGNVYPHSALVELVTYHELCFPDIAWRYVDVDHEHWGDDLRRQIREDPPDVAAFTVYTATAVWAFVVAAEIKKANPDCIIIFGNDHEVHEVVISREGAALVHAGSG